MIKNLVILVTIGTTTFLLGRVIADKKVENELKKQIELLKEQNDLLKGGLACLKTSKTK